MYFSVTSANCSTSPVLRSVLETRTDFTKPPNSAPMTSSGTASDLIESMAIPSRPIRLTASAPSTRSRIPSRTCLNTAHLAPPHLRQPLLETGNFLLDRHECLSSTESREFFADGVVIGIALQDRLVDSPRVGDEALPRVEVGHRDGVGRLRRCSGQLLLRRREDVGWLFFLAAPRRRHLGGERRLLDVDAHGRLDLDRGGGEVFDRFLERALVVRGEHRLL